MATPFERTVDGFELQFGTNHLGHFLSTNLLTPAAGRPRRSRVVNLSSGGHRSSDIIWDDPNYERREYDKFESYGQSKTANILFSVELDRRLSDRGVRSYAVHPGMISTELGRYMTATTIRRPAERAKSSPSGGLPQRKSIESGAATSVWAATADELRTQGGVYCEDCAVSDQHAPWALDADAGAAGCGRCPKPSSARAFRSSEHSDAHNPRAIDRSGRLLVRARHPCAVCRDRRDGHRPPRVVPSVSRRGACCVLAQHRSRLRVVARVGFELRRDRSRAQIRPAVLLRRCRHRAPEAAHSYPRDLSDCVPAHRCRRDPPDRRHAHGCVDPNGRPIRLPPGSPTSDSAPKHSSCGVRYVSTRIEHHKNGSRTGVAQGR